MARKELLVVLALCLLVLVCYWPAQDHGFINMDDPPNLTQFINIQPGLTMDGVAWAFRTIEPGYWRPLVWLSHMLDWQLFGEHSGGHHWTNVVLHLISTLLLFAILCNLSGAVWRSACVAALFAAHPMNVGSVAWIANRPGLLSVCFGLLSLYCYTRYLRNLRWEWYLSVAAAFSLSLMAKPMLVTLPFLLFLIDFWPGGRWAPSMSPVGYVPASGLSRPSCPPASSLELLREKIPLMLISAVSVVLTLVAAQIIGISKPSDQLPLDLRIASGLQSYVIYIKKLLWPVDLAFPYPHPGSYMLEQAVVAGLIIIAISLIVVAKKGGRPYLLTGWFWFLGTLLPVIGLVQYGREALADRYIYFPGIGLFILIVWGATDLGQFLRKKRAAQPSKAVPATIKGAATIPLPDFPSEERRSAILRPLLICIFVLVILLAVFTTRKQLSHWKNSRTLFTHAVSVTSGNDIAHANLAHALFYDGLLEEAADHIEEAIRIRPQHANHFFNYGAVLDHQKKKQAAMDQYRKAILLDPDHVKALFNLGRSLEILGRYTEAENYYRTVVLEKPDHFYAQRQLGLIALYNKRYGEAIGYLQTALRIQPWDRATQEGLSRASAREEHPKKEIEY